MNSSGKSKSPKLSITARRFFDPSLRRFMHYQRVTKKLTSCR